MKKQTMYECFCCRERHSTENVSPTCAKCVYDQKFEMQNTILEQGRIIDRLRAQVVEAEAKFAELKREVAIWRATFGDVKIFVGPAPGCFVEMTGAQLVDEKMGRKP